jgi:outer membrane protein TolC
MGTDEFMNYFLIGLQLKWNIFDGFKKRAQINQLLTQVESLNNEKLKLYDKWDRALAASKSEYQRATEKAQAAGLSKKAAEELVRSLSESLKAGIITSVDYLNAVNTLALSELKFEQAKFQQRAATINALYASGREIRF